MKTLFFALLLCLSLFLITCKKDKPVSGDTALTGKWKLTESLDDPGNGSGKWMAVPNSAVVYVEFENNGKLEGTAFPEYVSYVVKDSVTLTFTSKDNELQNYRYSINARTMTLSPAGPIRCYEACGTKYVKLN